MENLINKVSEVDKKFPEEMNKEKRFEF